MFNQIIAVRKKFAGAVKSLHEAQLALANASYQDALSGLIEFCLYASDALKDLGHALDEIEAEYIRMQNENEEREDAAE